MFGTEEGRPISERIKTLRKYLGLSQSEFARKINKTAGFISLIETERSGISDETILTICSTFDVREEWLRDGSGDMLTTEQAPVDKTNVGARIRQIRKERKLTQKEFAEHIGFSEIQVSLVETGKIIPSNNFLMCVSRGFNVSYDWLMTGVGEIEAAAEKVDSDLIEALEAHPEVIRELRKRFGLERRH